MSKERYVWLDGQKIPVSEEVYRAYYRPVWREVKQKRIREDKECSLDALMDDGFEAPSREALADEIIADKLLLDKLLEIQSDLSGDEQALIDALYYAEKSERDYAAETNVTHQAVHKRKNRILKKLRYLLDF